MKSTRFGNFSLKTSQQRTGLPRCRHGMQLNDGSGLKLPRLLFRRPIFPGAVIRSLEPFSILPARLERHGAEMSKVRGQISKRLNRFGQLLLEEKEIMIGPARSR